jgi:hypothetical protein
MKDDTFAAENAALADEFAAPGTVKHFALRLGFMPFDEAAAEAILRGAIEEVEDAAFYAAAKEANLARLRATVAGLEKACREAREDVEEWAEDLGDERQRVTLKQLWGLSRRLDAALGAAGAGTTEDPAS